AVGLLQALGVGVVKPEVGLAVRDDGPLDERVQLVQLGRVHAGQAQVGFGGLDQVLHLAVVSGGAGADAESQLDVIEQGHRPSPQRKWAPSTNQHPAPHPYSSPFPFPFPFGSAFFLMSTTPFGSASLPSAIILALLIHSSVFSSK